MYANYFGFCAAPFPLTPDPRLYYRNAMYDEAYQSILQAIRARQGLILLTGESGTGKTSLLQSIAQSLEKPTHAMVLPSAMIPSFPEIIQFLCAQFALDVTTTDPFHLLPVIERYLWTRDLDGGSEVLFIDEAQHLNKETLDRLRLFLNLTCNNRNLLQVVLVGQPELAAKLNQPELWHLRSYVGLSCTLTSLAEVEVEAFIRYRLQAVGYDGPELFPAEVTRRIARYSQAIPREVNRICDNALHTAYLTNRRVVSLDILAEVLDDLSLGEMDETHLPYAPRTSVLSRVQNLAGRVGSSVGLSGVPEVPSFLSQVMLVGVGILALVVSQILNITEIRQARREIVAGEIVAQVEQHRRLFPPQDVEGPQMIRQPQSFPAREEAPESQQTAAAKTTAMTPDVMRSTTSPPGEDPRIVRESSRAHLTSRPAAAPTVPSSPRVVSRRLQQEELLTAVKQRHVSSEERPVARQERDLSTKLVTNTTDDSVPLSDASLDLARARLREDAQYQLQQLGITINEPTLLANIEAGEMQTVELLLQSGVSPNVTDSYGWTALMLAARDGHEQIVQRLLTAGADVYRRNRAGGTALLAAAVNGHVSLLRMLLDHRADINASNHQGWTALMYAAWKGHRDVVELLLARGADAEKKDKEGKTAFMYALWKEQSTDSAQTGIVNAAAEVPLQSYRDIQSLLRNAEVH